ncbi:efflux RND transporter permease subunit, partial [Microvirga sp. 3-52]|nr:efflux RND transporter permease subunit [Microvirga sp. 3-52]
PNGSSTTATNDVVKKIETELKKQDDVEVYVSLVGGTQESLAQGSSNANHAEVYVKMVPLGERDRSVFEFVDEVQPIVSKAVGKDAIVSFNMQTASGSSPNTLSFALNDTNEKRLDKAVTQLNKELKKIDAVTEVTNTLA